MAKALVEEKKTKKEVAKAKNAFNAKNYYVIGAGVVLLVIGFILMSGGKSPSPEEFHYDQIFSPVRITVAPIVCLIGYVIVGIGIMKKFR